MAAAAEAAEAEEAAEAAEAAAVEEGAGGTEGAAAEEGAAAPAGLVGITRSEDGKPATPWEVVPSEGNVATCDRQGEG